METKETNDLDMSIISQNFTAVKFLSEEKLPFDFYYDDIIGKTGTILNYHNQYPQYVLVRFNVNGIEKHLHWPAHVVLDQLKKLNDPEHLQELYIEIFKTIRQICVIQK